MAKLRVARMGATASRGVKKPHRYYPFLSPGTVTLRQIRRYQKTTDLLISKASFGRVVREILRKRSGSSSMCIQLEAVEALQSAAEAHIVRLFSAAQEVAVKAKRITVMSGDLDFVLQLRKE